METPTAQERLVAAFLRERAARHEAAAAQCRRLLDLLELEGPEDTHAPHHGVRSAGS